MIIANVVHSVKRQFLGRELQLTQRWDRLGGGSSASLVYTAAAEWQLAERQHSDSIDKRTFQ